MSELSQATQRLIRGYQNCYRFFQLKEKEGVIHVDEVASRVASFYERMRGVIDFREEHLLRKRAIERVLKRRLFLKKNAQNLAEPLIHELIRSGHFPNDAIAESKITEIQKLIDKYLYLLENSPASQERAKMRLYNWLLGIAACEIEEVLSPPLKEKALMEHMLENMKERIQIKEKVLAVKKIPEEEKIIQLSIAIQRALFKLDPPIISYGLLKTWYADWLNLSQPALAEIAKNIYLIWDKIEKQLNHPLAEKFYSITEIYDTSYLILGGVIAQNPNKAQEVLGSPEVLESKIRQIYNERLIKVKARIKRATIYSTAAIFLTKALIALIIEAPLDKNLTSPLLVLNILIPTCLMFLLVLSIRPPSRQNEDMVVMEVMKIAYQKGRKDIYTIQPFAQRNFIVNSIIVLLYLLSFAASFGLIVWGLQKLNFSLISILIFLMFVSLISFAGVKIRQRAKELVVEQEKETFLRTFFDLFSLPIIQVGRWLSGQWSKYNALAVLFNSLLDMPFQIFVEFFEQWRLFLKEKKEKIR